MNERIVSQVADTYRRFLEVTGCDHVAAAVLTHAAIMADIFGPKESSGPMPKHATQDNPNRAKERLEDWTDDDL